MVKVGVIGYGNMGRAIAERIKHKYAVCVFDKNKSIDSESLTVADNLAELANQSEIIVLAVKPQDINPLFNEIKFLVKDKLIISIAAGVTSVDIRSQLAQNARVIRVMPNLPAQVGKGVSVLFKDKFATEDDLRMALQLLGCVGLALPIDDENIINAATAVSGSGPAFFCYYIKDKANANKQRSEFIAMLAEAAMSINLDKQFARILSEQTVDGTIAILNEKNLSCAELVKMVASKGGTTQAGLDVLQSGGLLRDAVSAALKRAAELGKRD